MKDQIRETLVRFVKLQVNTVYLSGDIVQDSLKMLKIRPQNWMRQPLVAMETCIVWFLEVAGSRREEYWLQRRHRLLPDCHRRL